MRYGGSYPMGFVDGHAKSLKMDVYSFQADGDPFDIMPANGNDIKLYCRDVDSPGERQGGYGHPNNCGVVADMIAKDRVRLP
jgi:prepilin-type processing-associated H-X9-DG protein